MIKATIVGGAGYTAGELIRVLIHHPGVIIDSISSTSQAGKSISDIHQDLLGIDLDFTNTPNLDVDVVFFCMGHGQSKSFLEKYEIPSKTKIIDLSQDFRWLENADFASRKFIYGLPEVNKESIANSNSIANPGCFATGIQLGLLPLAANNLIKHEVVINAITGSTGAGQSPSATTHFSWRNNNISSYKIFNHQHLIEISETLTSLQGNELGDLTFIPLRGDFSRGIFATLFTHSDKTLKEINELYESFFSDHPFVHVVNSPIHLKQVVNTNKAVIHLEKDGEKLLITTAIDNLLKGASGQAVQNMNLMFGIEETTGLNLKGSIF